MPDYKWEQITPLSDDEREIDLAAITPLYDTWRSAKAKLQESSPTNLKTFEDRLIRRLSVETGILERLYDLDRGTTEALVTNGFAEELVSRSSTDIEPSRLIDFLRDQEAAIQLVMDCVARSRELTIAVVHELHSILTKNQDTTVAVDQVGNRLTIPLLKGKFKAQPNNPRRPDGSVHEYCPPIHVQSEMDNLLEWLQSYEDEDPIIAASWFHHRFTQIHPYQDGNGRVARTISTLILLRANLLPLVIDRDLRDDYLKALEEADFGKLNLLASLFARLERLAVMQALSIEVDAQVAQEQRLTSAVIQSLVAKFDRRKAKKDTELRKVNELGARLRQKTRTFLEDALSRLKNTLSGSVDSDIHMQEGGPERGNAHWYRREVRESAKQADTSANFDEDHYFIKATMRVDKERLTFVTSFHHVGRELSGVMEATAFAQIKPLEDSDDHESVSQNFFHCSLDPYVFTFKTNMGDIEQSFDQWLDAALAVSLKEFGDRL